MIQSGKARWNPGAPRPNPTPLPTPPFTPWWSQQQHSPDNPLLISWIAQSIKSIHIQSSSDKQMESSSSREAQGRLIRA